MIVNVNRIPTITIGYLGENIVTQITFNYSQWKALHGEGTLALELKRNGDANAYPVALEHDYEESLATWIVTNTDLAKEGFGEAQLVYVVNDEAIKKSAVFTVNVNRSIENGATPPDPYEVWLDEIIRLSEETAENAESASRDAQSAVNSKDVALLYQNNAVESERNASQSEGNAREYANSAGNFASNAYASAESAASDANLASESEQNANTYKNQASGFADNAATSAGLASGFATQAESYKNQAKAYAESAEPLSFTDPNDDGNIVILKTYEGGNE